MYMWSAAHCTVLRKWAPLGFAVLEAVVWGLPRSAWPVALTCVAIVLVPAHPFPPPLRPRPLSKYELGFIKLHVASHRSTM